jgi:hypothetical protein
MNRKHLALVINCEFMWRISGVWSVGGGGGRHVEEETDLCQPFLTGSPGREKEGLRLVQERECYKSCDWCSKVGIIVVIGAEEEGEEN